MRLSADRPPADDMHGDGLALGLALRRARHRRPRVALLAGMPFLALRAGSRSPVAGLPLDDAFAGEMAWAGPNVPVAVGSSQPAGSAGRREVVAGTPVQPVPPAGPTRSDGVRSGRIGASDDPAAPPSAPALGMMLAKSDGVGRTKAAGLPASRTPTLALFGLVGEAVRGFSKASAGTAAAADRHSESSRTAGLFRPPFSGAFERPTALPPTAEPPRPALQEPAQSGQSSVSIFGRIAAASAADPRPQLQSDFTVDAALHPETGRQQPRTVSFVTSDQPARASSGASARRLAVGTASGAGQALLNLLPALAIRASGATAQNGRAPDLSGRGPVSAEPGVGFRRKNGMASPAIPSATPYRPETQPLPARETIAGIASLDMAIGMLGGMVERTVERAIERRTATDRRPPGQEPEPAPPRPSAGEIASEGAVRALIQRMRDKAQEERFRVGRLR